MSDYALLRRLLTAEQRRRAAHYRYRPHQRAGAMSEIAAGLAALERLAGRTPAPASPSQPTLWQDKFDA